MFGRHTKKASPKGRRQGRLMLLISLLSILLGNLMMSVKSYALPTLALPDSGIYSENGKQIYYNSLIFSGPNTVQEGDSLTQQPDGFNYKPGTIYYLYIKPSDQGKTDAFIITVDRAENPTQGQYSKYAFSTDTKAYSNRSDTKNISLVAGEIPTIRNCNIPWIGWIVCPISNALATALDDLYNIVTDILTISPIDSEKNFASGQQKPIYAIWSIIRGISNAVFIILFLIVIFSYVTGFGMSDYAIKKVFPRLVVTAVLVNLSLTICTLLIDVFNIFGTSIAKIFTDIQASTMPESDITAINAVNWAGLLASAYGAGSLALALNGGVVGSTLLVLGGMAGALLTIVAVVIALSARQALVIILTVVSPLAFVLNLLPNTEKWFKKWWSMFVKILAIFPIFGLIYGASQLASSIIIQTANDSFILILVGLIVKVIPFGLLITIIRSSDAIMDRIAQAASNQTKSLGEGAQAFLHRKQELQKTKYETGSPRSFAGRFTPRGMAQTFNQGRRRDEALLRQTKANQETAYSRMVAQKYADGTPANINARAEMTARAAEEEMSVAKTQADISFNTLKARIDLDVTKAKGKLSGFNDELELKLAQNSLSKQIADTELRSVGYMQVEQQSRRVIDNIKIPKELGHKPGVDLHTAMAGINTDYKEYILADVIKMQRKEREDSIAAAQELLNQINLSEADTVSLAAGIDHMGSTINSRLRNAGGKLTVKGKDGLDYIIDSKSDALAYAATNKIGSMPRSDLHEFLQFATVTDSNNPDQNKLMTQRLKDYREEVSNLIWKSNAGASDMAMGIKTPDYIKRGLFRGMDTLYEVAFENVAKGRYSVDKIASQNKDALDRMALGFEKLVEGKKIDIAELDSSGNIVSRTLEEHIRHLNGSRDDTTIASVETLQSFKKNIQEAFNNPDTARQIQPAQKLRLERIMNSIDTFTSNVRTSRAAEIAEETRLTGRTLDDVIV